MNARKQMRGIAGVIAHWTKECFFISNRRFTEVGLQVTGNVFIITKNSPGKKSYEYVNVGNQNPNPKEASACVADRKTAKKSQLSP